MLDTQLCKCTQHILLSLVVLGVEPKTYLGQGQVREVFNLCETFPSVFLFACLFLIVFEILSEFKTSLGLELTASCLHFPSEKDS